MLAENRTFARTQPSPTYVTHGAQKTEENKGPNLGIGYKLWSKEGSEGPKVQQKTATQHKGGEHPTGSPFFGLPFRTPFWNTGFFFRRNAAF